MNFTYIGDSRTKEFHSLKRQKPQCNVKRITKKHQVLFFLGREAKEAGFDPCAFCCGSKRGGHWKSLDNK